MYRLVILRLMISWEQLWIWMQGVGPGFISWYIQSFSGIFAILRRISPPFYGEIGGIWRCDVALFICNSPISPKGLFGRTLWLEHILPWYQSYQSYWRTHTHTHLACSWNQQPSTKTTFVISYILTMFFSECRISQLYPFTLRFLGYQSGIESSMQLYQLSSSQRDCFGLPKIASLITNPTALHGVLAIQISGQIINNPL